jgi:hypothetical protein
LERFLRLCLILALLACLAADAGSTARRPKPALRIALVGEGQVKSRDGLIDCPGRCFARYYPGARVRLMAAPDAYFSDVRWTGECVGVAATCIVSVDRNATVRPSFERKQGSLSMSVTGRGAIEVEPGGALIRGGFSQVVPEGMPLTFTPRPDAGAVFKGWGGGCASSPPDACTFLADDGPEVAAAFGLSGSEEGTRTLTVRTTGYAVRSDPPGIDCGASCSAAFPAGTVVTLHGDVPEGIERFWSGACAGQTRTCVLVMDASEDVDFLVPPAEWGVRSARVTVAGPGRVTDESSNIRCGRGGSDCLAQAFGGRPLRLELVAKPTRGARFGGWRGGCHGRSRTCSASSDVLAFFRRPSR